MLVPLVEQKGERVVGGATRRMLGTECSFGDLEAEALFVLRLFEGAERGVGLAERKMGAREQTFLRPERAFGVADGSRVPLRRLRVLAVRALDSSDPELVVQGFAAVGTEHSLDLRKGLFGRLAGVRWFSGQKGRVRGRTERRCGAERVRRRVSGEGCNRFRRAEARSAFTAARCVASAASKHTGSGRSAAARLDAMQAAFFSLVHAAPAAS